MPKRFHVIYLLLCSHLDYILKNRIKNLITWYVKAKHTDDCEHYGYVFYYVYRFIKHKHSCNCYKRCPTPVHKARYIYINCFKCQCHNFKTRYTNNNTDVTIFVAVGWFQVYYATCFKQYCYKKINLAYWVSPLGVCWIYKILHCISYLCR